MAILPLTLGLSRVNPTTQPGMLLPSNKHFLPALSCCQSPFKTTQVGGPWKSEGCSLPSPPHSLHVRLLLHTLTPSQDGLRGMARERKQGSRGKKPAGGICGTCRVENLARWRLAVDGVAWGCRLRQSPAKGCMFHPRDTQHPPALPGVRHLCSGQVSSSARGRGHSTGARATAQGDRLTGQAWLPGHLPSLGVGGSRPVPTIGWCRGKGFSPEGKGQEPVLFLGTDDTGDPNLSSKNMGHVLDPTSPPGLTPHIHTWGLKEDIRSLITPSSQPTDWVPGSTGWQGPPYSHQHNS